MDQDYMGYAIAKAIWAYEPNYALNKMGELKTDYVVNPIEEKEALLCLSTHNEKFEKTFDAVVEEGFIDEFINYEIAAKKHPEIMLLLPKSAIERCILYINRFH